MFTTGCSFVRVIVLNLQVLHILSMINKENDMVELAIVN